MSFLVNEEQWVKKVKKTEKSKNYHKYYRRCFRIDLLLFSFCVFYVLSSALLSEIYHSSLLFTDLYFPLMALLHFPPPFKISSFMFFLCYYGVSYDNNHKLRCNLRYVHHAKFHCIFTTLNKLLALFQSPLSNSIFKSLFNVIMMQ